MASVSTTYELDVLRINVAAPRRLLTLAFSVLWFSGWIFTAAIAAAALLWQPEADFRKDAMALVVWGFAGLPTAVGLLWAAGGRQEALLVAGSQLILQRRAWWVKRSRVLDAFAVRNVRVSTTVEGSSDRHAIRQFWTDGAGRVQFDCNQRTYGFGVTATGTDAASVVATIATRFPHMTSANPETDAVKPPSRWRRWALVYVTFMLLVPVMVPIRLAAQDRVTCFGGENDLPYAPVDLRSLHGTGRVYLVPFDDFPPVKAKAVAEHYRREFGTPVELAPAAARPSDAYNGERRQWSVSPLLTTLKHRYPSEGTVAIGLTQSDIYIPGVNWRYAFSYRDEGRLAVVSTARMQRGCLGLVRASEDRLMARLRKMVGKNIGVLYYKLPLSRDRRSLLYAYVGGPQELDAMSERY